MLAACFIEETINLIESAQLVTLYVALRIQALFTVAFVM